MMLTPMTIIRNGLKRSPLRKAVMNYRHFGLRSTDVFLASYPRSGNTWMKSLLATCIYGEAMQNFSDKVNPVIPIVGFHRGVKPMLAASGRIIKTHESYRPEYRKAVWIVRDPRDVVLSEYKLEQRSRTFSGSFEQYVARFANAHLNGTPNWGSHTRSWMDSPLAASSDLIQIRFEDMRLDPARELNRVLDFMGLNSHELLISAAIEQNSIRSMSERHSAYDKTLGTAIKTDVPAVNKGQSGGWRQALSSDAVNQIEDRFGDTIEALGYDRSLP